MFSRFVLSILLVFAVSLAPPAQAQAASQAHRRSAAQKKNSKQRRSRKVTPEQKQRIRRAFVASSDLRPMAKQLLEQPAPAAYAGVERYALRHHLDEGGTLAHLVLGYAHLQAKEYPQAEKELKLAASRGGELSDYADFFLAQNAAAQNDQQTVAALLAGFDEKHPDSLFIRQAEIMRASALTATGKNDEAVRLLESMRDSKPDVELELGRAYAASGQSAKAVAVWNHIYAEMPLSQEAAAAQLELLKVASTGLISTPTLAQRQTRAELLMKGRRYDQAADEYRAILDSIRSDMSQESLQLELRTKLAGALYHTRKLDEAKSLLESVPAGNDDSEALRLYYLHEIARSQDDGDKERQIVAEMMQKFPASTWLQEALLSASNMYLLRPDYKTAVEFYSSQFKLFPKGKYAPYSHWKAAWLNLRMGNKDEAKRLMDEQIANYPAGQEIPAALYWRARLAEEEGDYDRAGEYYKFIQEHFTHYYYADLAQERLRFRFDQSKHDSRLDRIPEQPDVIKADFAAPSDDLRVARAQLLTNAALFDFAVRELQSESDKLYAQAEIARVYLKADRPDRALQSFKRAVPGYFAGEIDDMPQWAWGVLFPKPYWGDLTRYSSANGLDPYLVASLIRQESEFNPQAVSRANAWGLMQLLPPVGRQLAKEVRMHRFNPDQLTDPSVNLELGTRYFKHMVDSFGGQVEYALAAYNAGVDRVKTWQAQGPYRDIHEFVESIPFTETREYVQAIMRNATVYRLLYSNSNVETARAKSDSGG
ncbi:MAG TPA: transglycosylase SLT domain-containing protein [Terriglobales bacterium]|nr:transglycosylase SLT domain-containing protein [Terriglobales bacterium]